MEKIKKAILNINLVLTITAIAFLNLLFLFVVAICNVKIGIHLTNIQIEDSLNINIIQNLIIFISMKILRIIQKKNSILVNIIGPMSVLLINSPIYSLAIRVPYLAEAYYEKLYSYRYLYVIRKWTVPDKIEKIEEFLQKNAEIKYLFPETINIIKQEVNTEPMTSMSDCMNTLRALQERAEEICINNNITIENIITSTSEEPMFSSTEIALIVSTIILTSLLYYIITDARKTN